MKACIKAWRNIYNENGLITDEYSLKALDGILYGPVWEIKEVSMDIAEKMADEFEQLHPDFRYDNLEVITR